LKRVEARSLPHEYGDFIVAEERAGKASGTGDGTTGRKPNFVAACLNAT
jgi:hypothetical protein